MFWFGRDLWSWFNPAQSKLSFKVCSELCWTKCDNFQGWRPWNLSGNLFQCLITLTVNIVFPWSRQISFATPCDNSLTCFCLLVLRRAWLCIHYCSFLGGWRHQSNPPLAFFSPGWTNTFLLVSVCRVLQSPKHPSHQLLLGASKARHCFGWSFTRAKQKEITTLIPPGYNFAVQYAVILHCHKGALLPHIQLAVHHALICRDDF